MRVRRAAAGQRLEPVLTCWASFHMGHDRGFVGVVQLFIKQANEMFGAGT